MKDFKIAILIFFALTFLTGIVYPFAIDRATRAFFPEQATGSLIRVGDRIVGSELIGQEFKRRDYFWGRPSAVGNQPMPSGGSNASGTSEGLRKQLEDRRKEGRTGDLLFASASGVDPDISPESAFAQVERIAAERKIPKEELDRLVENGVSERRWGFLGERRVNVLRLNLRLDERALALRPRSR